MKQLLIMGLTLLSLNTTLNATDLLVEEFGLAPAYSSIAAAVSAASDGDRIIIKNKAGNLPWVENITIGKSLEFLSYTNDSFFIVQGTYFIQPADNRTISIIGMRNLNGTIYINTSGNTAARTNINIYDSYLSSGNLNFSYSGYKVNIVGNKLSNGYINFNYGNVVGNDITYGGNAAGIRCNTDGLANNTIHNIVGNRVRQNNTSTSYYGIHWNSSAHFFNIRNNFVYTKCQGIGISTIKNSSTVVQGVYNNTVVFVNGSSSSVSRYGITNSASGSAFELEVMNNLIDFAASYSSPTYRGIYSVSSTANRYVYYNTVDNASGLDYKIDGSWTVNSNNNVSSSVTVNQTTGTSSQGVNEGHPAAPYYDLDLTRNNCGVYGGSYSQDNYFPQFTGSARVWYIDYPFNVRQGNTIDIQAESFDR